MLVAVGSDDGALARRRGAGAMLARQTPVAVAVSVRDLIGRSPSPARPLAVDPPAPAARALPAYPPPATPPDAGGRRGRGIGRRRTAALVAAAGLASLITVALLSTSLGGSAITDQVNARLASAGKQATGYLEQVIAGRRCRQRAAGPGAGGGQPRGKPGGHGRPHRPVHGRDAEPGPRPHQCERIARLPGRRPGPPGRPAIGVGRQQRARRLPGGGGTVVAHSSRRRRRRPGP